MTLPKLTLFLQGRVLCLQGERKSLLQAFLPLSPEMVKQLTRKQIQVFARPRLLILSSSPNLVLLGLNPMSGSAGFAASALVLDSQMCCKSYLSTGRVSSTGGEACAAKEAPATRGGKVIRRGEGVGNRERDRQKCHKKCLRCQQQAITRQ